MTRGKGKLHLAGTILLTKRGKKVEITSCYRGSWMSEDGYHVKLDGEYIRDRLGGIRYIEAAKLDRILADN